VAASRRASPARSTLTAPTRSAWDCRPHRAHRNSARVTRLSAAQCPQDGHVREVLRGSTAISSRPALSALAARIDRNTPQPASRIDRLSPAFCATRVPGVCAVPRAERHMLLIRSASWQITSWCATSRFATLWAWSSRWRRTRPCTAATRARTARRRFEPRWQRDRARCAAVSFSAAARRWRGLATCCPSEVVRNDATPRSIPTTRPVAGSGAAGTSSQESTTYQRRPSRFTLIVLMCPASARC
jgi:hypothetical protein